MTRYWNWPPAAPPPPPVIYRDETGAHVRRIGGDGNCLFRALACRLLGDEERHLEMRGLLTAHVFKHWSEIYRALTFIQDREQYLYYMRHEGVYGGWAEGFAAAELFRRTVAFVQNGTVYASSVYDHDPDPIVLRRSGDGIGAHFDAYLSLPGGMELHRAQETLMGHAGGAGGQSASTQTVLPPPPLPQPGPPQPSCSDTQRHQPPGSGTRRRPPQPPPTAPPLQPQQPSEPQAGCSRPPAEAAPPTPPRPATSPARPAALGESGHAGLKTPVKDRCSVSRTRESPEERQARLAKRREAKSAARAKESAEAKEARLAKQRARRRAKKQESPQVREDRQEKMRQPRAKESAEAKEARLAKQRARRRAREQESPQVREDRQEKMRESRAKESAEAKEARLAKQRARRRAAKEQESDQERDAKSAEKRRQMRLHRAQTAKRAKRVLFSVSQEESSCGDASDSDSTDWSSHSDGCQLEDDVSDCDAYGEATNGYRTLDPNDPVIIAEVKRRATERLEGVAAAVCCVCDRIIHTLKVKEFDAARYKPRRQELKADQVADKLRSLVSEPGQNELCGTCYSHVIKGKTPTMARVNGFKYPEVPADLPPLTEVAEHILAPRIPFQQITNLGRMGRRGQFGIRGSVINIPTAPKDTVEQVIPLMPGDDEVYVVNLKRKRVHKRPYASSYVGKEMLTKWGTYLQETELYQKYQVTFDPVRVWEVPEASEDPTDPENQEFDGQAQYSILMTDALAVSRPRPADTTEDITIAPGEHQQPISVVTDRECEELSFPSVYLGEARNFTVPVSRYVAMKSEVRRRDRRGAKPRPVLYKWAVHAREQVARRLRHRFRRGAAKHLGKAVTKSMLDDPTFTASSQRQGLAIPNLMPNSAQYWKAIGHDVFAMVRQLSKPHLFFTISAAEHKWPILLRTLQRLSKTPGQVEQHAAGPGGQEAMVTGAEVPAADPSGIPSDERLKLVREDPVVCAMYFREVVEEVRRCLRMDRGRGPMGQYPVRDYLFRIEFQSRGSPHLHCLLWLDNAPEDPLADPEAAARFIDSLISCSASAPNAEVNRHKHTATCFRNKTVLRRFWKKELTEQDMHRHCRFGAPFWPSPRTRILLPLYHKDANEQFLAGGKSWREHLQELRERAPDRRRPRQPQPQPQQEDTWEDYLAEVRSLRHRLKDVLVSETCPETVEELWQQAGCPDEESYLVAIRSGMLRPMVLYRREMADRWTNSYLPWVLEVFGSNTDAQLILDVYSLVRYCVGYITKGEKTHSELHRHMLRLRRERGYDDRELLYKISSEALRSKETSAQEAAWILLQFPLSEKSRQCRFIDTSVPDERKRSPKTGKEWQDLAQDSSDIWRPDVFDEYARRPEHLEGVSLAAYVASYLNSTRKKDAEGHVQPRGRDWVIRWRKFNPKSEKSAEREDFYRSMCTLHMPWREEAEEILRPGEASTFEALYQRHEEVILRGRRRFEADLELEQDLDLEKAQCVAEDEAENCELDDLVRRYVAGTSKYVFEEEEEAEYMDGPGQDIRVDVPGAAPAAARVVAEARQRAQWDRETLHRVIRTLNKRQRDVVLSVIDGIRSRSAPRLLYIDGTAGVGKSLVARCLANAFEMFAPNNIPGYPKCFVSAPTGKAADNVEGMTIHSLYVLPFNQQSKRKQSAEEDTRLAPLNPETLAKLQNRFSDAYGQLIDEVSMLSQLQLVLIDLRCKEATGRQDVPFGGLWTIVIGDFRQLKPVGGQSLLDVSTSSLAGALPLWNQFEYVELTENMRQGEDKDFANVLRKIGDYEQLTDEERRLIESRCVRLNKLQVPDSATRLYKLNADVDRYNTEQLMANPAEKIIVIEARDRVEQKGNYMHSVPASTRRRLEEHGDKYLERALQLNTQQAAGLPASLVAVVGFPYLLTRNIDTADGLVNGAVGELVWVEFGRLRRPHQTADGAEEEVAVRRLWMRFPGRTGRARSAANRQQLRDAIAVSQQYAEHAWPYDMPPPPTEAELEGLVPFEREDLKLESIKTEDWRQVKRQQFPLVPALAMTIHKVQGSTKDYVLVLYDPSYTNPLVYVALSRVTKLEGLFIDDAELLPDEEGRLFQHPPRLSACGAKVLTAKEKRDMESLRAERDRFLADKERLRGRQLVPRWHALQDPDNSLYERRVLYHNVQGLAVHLEDIQRDEVYMSAEVLLLAETHLKPQDQVELGEGWRMVARCDWISGINRGGGAAIYSRVPCAEVRCPRKQDMEAAMVQLGPKLRLAVMYCHGKPKAADVVEYVRALLASAPPGVSTLLAGDFNINMCHPAAGQGAQLVEGLAALGLGMLNDNKVHTTYWDQGGATVIDAVFSDVAAPVLQVETYQSYFSYHLPLVVSMEYV